MEMDSKLKKRIVLFYIGGVINALLGFYVLINGHSFLAPGTARTLVIVFALFAALDFYMPYAIRKKWMADNAGMQAQGNDPMQHRNP